MVCDDDATMRGVVSKVATMAGLTVLAETDSATGAVDLVDRFRADVLVLDLALPFGSGSQVVRELRERSSPCQIVVFTSYAADDPSVRELRVRAVVEKPDFIRLEEVLLEAAGGAGERGVEGDERRGRVPTRVGFPPPLALSPSGLEAPSSFAGALEALEPGDGVLVVRVSGAESTPDRHGRLLAVDQVLNVARLLRVVLRVQDRMAIGDDDVELVAVLLSAGRTGVVSVWERLERAHQLATNPGVLSAGWAVVEPNEAPTSTPGRARDAALHSVGQPPGDRLWAG